MKNKKEFPIHVFPKVVEDYVKEYARVNSFDANYMSSAFLSLISTLICGKYIAKISNSWFESPLLWQAIVGNSGDKKSPSVGQILKPLYEQHSKLYKKYLKELEQAEDDDQQLKVKAKQLIVRDSTYEALIQVLSNNKEGVLLHEDELLSLLCDGNRLSQHVDAMLSIFNNQDITLNRKTNSEYKVIEKPSLGIIGGFQIKLLQKFIGKGRMESGFVMRFLFTLNSEQRFPLVIKDVNPEIIDSYITLVDRFISLRDNGEEITHVGLSESSINIFNQWRENNRVNRDVENRSEMKEYLSKMEAYVVRLALIIQSLDDLSSSKSVKEITNYSLQRGIELVEFYISNFDEVLSQGVSKNKNQKDEKRCMNDYVNFPESYSKKEKVQALYENGHIQKVIVGTLGIPKSTVSDYTKGLSPKSET